MMKIGYNSFSIRKIFVVKDFNTISNMLQRAPGNFIKSKNVYFVMKKQWTENDELT
jgi:hypothetical protein